MFCLITYKQLFWDGNKRTALCVANKILLPSGNGIITIKDNVIYEFNELLCRMYNTGDKEELKTFIYEKAIFGLDWSQKLTSNNPMAVFYYHILWCIHLFFTFPRKNNLYKKQNPFILIQFTKWCLYALLWEEIFLSQKPQQNTTKNLNG